MSLAQSYARIADLRGYSKLNPIIFTLEKDGTMFLLVYSEFEPKRAQLPVNVLWCEHGTNILRRRVSFDKSQDHLYTWALIDETQLYDEPQFYQFGTDEIRDLGVSASSFVGAATTEQEGLVRLLEKNNSAVVVVDEDPRLSNAREPLDHDHDDYPRTMIKINDNLHGVLDTAKHPEVGDLLFIDSQIDSTSYQCVWRKPTFQEIEWSQPVLQSISIRVPEGVTPSDNSQFLLVCDATWSDKFEERASARWEIEDNDYGVTITSSGLVSCPNISENVTLVVTAKKVDPFYKHTVTATFNLVIENLYDMPVALNILGMAQLMEETSEQYNYILSYESGRTEPVSPANVTVSEGEIEGGTFTAPRVDEDKTVTLSASVRVDGHKFSATKEITVVKDIALTLSFIYEGSAETSITVNETTRLDLPTYQIRLLSGKTVTIAADSAEGLVADDASLVADMANNFVKLENVIVDSTLTLINEVVYRGDRVNATLQVTVLDAFPFIEQLTIRGSDTLGPDLSFLYPMYGTQNTSPSEYYNLDALVDGNTSSVGDALSAMTYTVTWSLVTPNAAVLSHNQSNTSTHLLQISATESSGITDPIPLTLKAVVYVEELDKTFETTKDFTVLPTNLDNYVGPVFFDNGAGDSVTTAIEVPTNNDNDAGFNIHTFSTFLIPLSEDNQPLDYIPEDAVSFSNGQDNYNTYFNYTKLEFSCEEYEIEVISQKIVYTWRTAIWVRDIMPGETFNLTVTDPRIGKSYTQQFIAI